MKFLFILLLCYIWRKVLPLMACCEGWRFPELPGIAACHSGSQVSQGCSHRTATSDFSKHKTLTEPRFSFPPWQVEDYISLAQRENSSTSCGLSIPKDHNSILKGLNWNPRNTWVEKTNSDSLFPTHVSHQTHTHGCFLHTKQSVLPWNQLGTPDWCHLGHCQP